MPARSPTAGHRIRHDERLRVPWWWWLLVVGFSVSLWWAFALATPPWLSATIGITSLLTVGGLLWRYGDARVAVVETDEGAVVVAGRAHIPVALTGEPVELDAETLRHRLGPGADARSYVLVRPWSREAVLLPITDPSDPVPSWVVATSRGPALADALRAARTPLAD